MSAADAPGCGHSLPARIALVMGVSLFVFALTLGAAMVFMARALDREGAESATRLVEAALDTLLARSREVTLDYAKWAEAVRAVSRHDTDWLYSNMGSAAAAGTVAHLVLLWGGGLPRDLGWIDGSPPAGLSGLLGREALTLAERRLEPGSRGAESFFLWRGSDLFALAVAVVEPPDRPDALPDERKARLLLGRRVNQEEIVRMAGATLLEGLRLHRRPPSRGAYAALPGPDGRPVAFLGWESVNPGTALLRRMLPGLLPVTLLAGLLAAAGVRAARRGASELLAAERRARTAALTDPLTGLPNRAAFGAAMARPARAGERAVLFLDVDGFKRINDSLGHGAGDRVLQALADRLAALAGPDCLLARMGGDEFVFVVAGPDAEMRADWLARGVEQALGRPLEVDGHSLRVRAALGLAVQHQDGRAGDDLVRRADLAMYAAKRRGADRPAAPAVLTAEAPRERAALERALRAGLDRPEEWRVLYQPVLRLGDGTLAHAEALARWTSTELGPVGPERFIPAAEEAGLIAAIEHRILGMVCDDLAAFPGLSASINRSARALLSLDPAADLAAALTARGLPPSRLAVEVPGRLADADPALLAERLEALRRAGLAVILDDFGADRCSAIDLAALPLAGLKLDRRLVAGLGTVPGTAPLLDALLRLGGALGLPVCAKGVEAQAELALVQDLGCALAQGWLIGRPLPAADCARSWLARSAAVA
ncbi:bifunctional diguanylate cyclase/phosphodiesterase [Rubellimicrobium sp. CFH 75288]|uniref:putative bifunctional diguanylate cyclase/phosphodiesterase n=1 Tax=Rubellimicrobium sp. CFH 75288 TaxID=2697034 RepID=UPI00141292D1|nr:EAL domain-containing protein [Rubellimicrobium sp. CFH 75288]NAZ37972.1 EAL domain-containing protein [Rubellimicrobium sp. CFH 75288]